LVFELIETGAPVESFKINTDLNNAQTTVIGGDVVMTIARLQA
jgi:hypothetical protein